MLNSVVIPNIGGVSSKKYRNLDNSTVTVYRLTSHIRVFKVWNTSLNDVTALTLDDIDKPATTCDSPLFMTDEGKMGRFRLNTNGTINGWIFSTYGGSATSSDSSPTFIEFFYYV